MGAEKVKCCSSSNISQEEVRMKQDVQSVKNEVTEEVMVMSEGTTGPGQQIGICFGAIFIIRG